MANGAKLAIRTAAAAKEGARERRGSSTAALAKRLGLRLAAADELAIRRRRAGKGFMYLGADGTPLKDAEIVRRLASLAVPPAYEDVLYAEDPKAHLQAVGRDAAGRLQYRYHPQWDKVREMRKASRLARFAESLPRIRRSLGHHLGVGEPTREFALASVIELVALSAIRSGAENHARLRGTRGAATLLKSNVKVDGDTVILCFRAKGGKQVQKEFRASRLCAAIAVLRTVPGRRLFQYRQTNGEVRSATARAVNAFLREIAGVRISLKDFRTLLASVSVLSALSQETPAASKRARRRQVLEAIRAAADDLSNTPTICAKSYVHETVVNAFEDGVLEQFAETLKGCRSPARREKALAEVLASAAMSSAAA
jgi:DNA topoisomerase-1